MNTTLDFTKKSTDLTAAVSEYRHSMAKFYAQDGDPHRSSFIHSEEARKGYKARMDIAILNIASILSPGTVVRLSERKDRRAPESLHATIGSADGQYSVDGIELKMNFSYDPAVRQREDCFSKFREMLTPGVNIKMEKDDGKSIELLMLSPDLNIGAAVALHYRDPKNERPIDLTEYGKLEIITNELK